MNFFYTPNIKKELLLAGLVWAASAAAGGIRYGSGGVVSATVLCFIYTILHTVFEYRRYRKITSLTGEVQHALHNSRITNINVQEEGELAVLQSEINKLFQKLSLQSSQLKEDKIFLMDSIANISHQIRTPLTSLNLISSMLRKPDLESAEQSRLVLELNGLLRHIEWLIQSLLKMAKLDADAVPMKRECVSLHKLAADVSGELAIALELHNQMLSVEMDSDASFTGDYLWTCEALTNIIKNCIEHTGEHGIIKVEARENHLFTRIDITDNGPGFSVRDLPHLFERFYKGENAGDQSIGIGLSLAKMIITRQGGILTAKNRPEGGAHFTITFYKTAI